MIEISGAGSVPRTSVSESATLVRPMRVVYHPTGTVYVYKKNDGAGAPVKHSRIVSARTQLSRARLVTVAISRLEFSAVPTSKAIPTN